MSADDELAAAVDEALTLDLDGDLLRSVRDPQTLRGLRVRVPAPSLRDDTLR